MLEAANSWLTNDLRRIGMLHVRCRIMLTVALALVAGMVHAQEKALATEVQSLTKSFSDAWESGDSAAMAELFTADGDLVLATGLKVNGRSQIKSTLTDEHERFMKGTRFRIEVDSVRELAAGVALMDGSAQLAGVRTPDGNAVQPLPHLVFAAVVRRAGEWKFEALRISVPVPTAPE
jgi:uncharacterized protein (TIGR02246 family)